MRAGALAIIIAGGCAAPAAGHQAQSGWTYPWACCSEKDCREVAEPTLVGGDAWRFSTGHVVKDADVKPAPDGLWHLCLTSGDRIVLCAFGPKGGV